MKWRIKQVKQPDGTVWYIPEYRKFMLWHKISVIEHLNKVFMPFGKAAPAIDHQYAIKEPFVGYTYLLSDEDAKKTIELYERYEAQHGKKQPDN